MSHTLTHRPVSCPSTEPNVRESLPDVEQWNNESLAFIEEIARKQLQNPGSDHFSDVISFVWQCQQSAVRKGVRTHRSNSWRWAKSMANEYNNRCRDRGEEQLQYDEEGEPIGVSASYGCRPDKIVEFCCDLIDWVSTQKPKYQQIVWLLKAGFTQRKIAEIVGYTYHNVYLVRKRLAAQYEEEVLGIQPPEPEFEGDVCVLVTMHSDHEFYRCVWRDPVSGKRRMRTTGTKDKQEAERFAARLEEEIKNSEPPEGVVVRVVKYGEHHAYYRCMWRDPATGIRRTRSTATNDKDEADQFAARLEQELNASAA